MSGVPRWLVVVSAFLLSGGCAGLNLDPQLKPADGFKVDWGDSVSAMSAEQFPELFLKGPAGYFFLAAERDALKNHPYITPAQWGEFLAWWWARRDPTSGTPANEFRDEFYRRVNVVENGGARALNGQHLTIQGWRSDQGKTYILLGPPMEVVHTVAGSSADVPVVPERDADPRRYREAQRFTFDVQKWVYSAAQIVGPENASRISRDTVEMYYARELADQWRFWSGSVDVASGRPNYFSLGIGAYENIFEARRKTLIADPYSELRVGGGETVTSLAKKPFAFEVRALAPPFYAVVIDPANLVLRDRGAMMEAQVQIAMGVRTSQKDEKLYAPISAIVTVALPTDTADQILRGADIIVVFEVHPRFLEQAPFIEVGVADLVARDVLKERHAGSAIVDGRPARKGFQASALNIRLEAAPESLAYDTRGEGWIELSPAMAVGRQPSAIDMALVVFMRGYAQVGGTGRVSWKTSQKTGEFLPETTAFRITVEPPPAHLILKDEIGGEIVVIR